MAINTLRTIFYDLMISATNERPLLAFYCNFSFWLFKDFQRFLLRRKSRHFNDYTTSV